MLLPFKRPRKNILKYVYQREEYPIRYQILGFSIGIGLNCLYRSTSVKNNKEKTIIPNIKMSGQSKKCQPLLTRHAPSEAQWILNKWCFRNLQRVPQSKNRPVKETRKKKQKDCWSGSVNGVQGDKEKTLYFT